MISRTYHYQAENYVDEGTIRSSGWVSVRSFLPAPARAYSAATKLLNKEKMGGWIMIRFVRI